MFLKHYFYSEGKQNSGSKQLRTTNVPTEYNAMVNVFGDSVGVAHGFEAADSIASNLQRMLNNNKKFMRVANYCMNAATLKNIANRIINSNISDDDIVVITISRQKFVNKYYFEYIMDENKLQY